MTADQLEFDFTVSVRRPSVAVLTAEALAKAEDDRARGVARRLDQVLEARAYWCVGMVTSLPIFCTIEGSEGRYTQMLPGVVEAITADSAAVRIYAAPEYGYTIDNYPLHKKLAIDVPLVELGAFHGNRELERLVSDGRLETGDHELAARVRSRFGERCMA